MHEDFEILTNLAVILPVALVLGFLTHRLRLSPILGYLLTGVVLGPQTPGFDADMHTAEQFAEIGVILLMFGVGLHFNLADLLAVRRVALPGALVQISVATLFGAVAMVAFGRAWEAGLVMGLAVSVASTVVLIRVLTDNNELQTEQGHIAVGWLIVEDLFTVLVLVMLPALAPILRGGNGGFGDVFWALGWATMQIVVLAAIVLGGGRFVIPWILRQVARTRTRELFTLTVLAVAMAVAVGSAMLFGVSMALGAFLAGMAVGQSEASHQAAADALPMQDAFAVLFFVSVGMLFTPASIIENPGLFAALLAVVLVAKPLSAAAIVWILGYSPRAALTVSIALAQVGEFSFILANLAVDHQLITSVGQSLLVASAMVSITINPLLFRLVVPLEAWLRRRPRLWQLVSSRSERHARKADSLEPAAPEETRAVLVGYGPVGRTAARLLKEFGITPVVVDMNVDTVKRLRDDGMAAVYGDATRRDVLKACGIESAKYLLITTPGIETRTVVIIVAKELNSSLKVFVRARYLQERAWLEEVGATEVCFEEAEAAMGLASLILNAVGASEERVRHELWTIREELALRHGLEPAPPPEPPSVPVDKA